MTMVLESRFCVVCPRVSVESAKKGGVVMLVPSFFVHQGVVQRCVAWLFPHMRCVQESLLVVILIGSLHLYMISPPPLYYTMDVSGYLKCFSYAMTLGGLCYRHPATCPCCHFSFRSRRMWYCFRRALYSRIKSLTSPSSPSRKLVARVSESSSDSVVNVSSFEYNAGGENGCHQFHCEKVVGTFKAWSISACFACHCFSRSLASANFSSAALRAWLISFCLERIRSTGLVWSMHRMRRCLQWNDLWTTFQSELGDCVGLEDV